MSLPPQPFACMPAAQGQALAQTLGPGAFRPQKSPRLQWWAFSEPGVSQALPKHHPLPITAARGLLWALGRTRKRLGEARAFVSQGKYPFCHSGAC